MNELIERLEKAAGADRDLDADIAVGILRRAGIEAIRALPSELCAPGTYWEQVGFGRTLRTAPNYTTSLDAAMTLLAPGYGIIMECNTINSDSYVRIVQHFDAKSPDDIAIEAGPKSRGKTPALALTIAAMKARQQHGGEGR